MLTKFCFNKAKKKIPQVRKIFKILVVLKDIKTTCENDFVC